MTLYPSLPYDAVKDFAPITLMWSFPSLLVVPADSPAKSVAELAAYAKTKPGGLSYGSQGNGSSGHLLGAMFARHVGVPMVHVPYRGAGPAALDVATGRIDFLFVSYASVLPHYLSGKVRALAVTSAKRLTALPQIPDRGGSRIPGLRARHLVRPARAGRHAGAGDRQAQRGVRPGRARARGRQADASTRAPSRSPTRRRNSPPTSIRRSSGWAKIVTTLGIKGE